MFDFGIVTTCRNAAETIDATIWSIVSQEGGYNIRYHIQDACSSDDTLDKIKAWKARLDEAQDAYPSHITFSFDSQRDKGMYDGLATAFENLEIADGTFMGWLNGDDILLPGAINAIVSFGRSQPGVSWVTGRPTIIDQFGRIELASRSHFFPREILAAGLADGINWCFLQQESTFWRKSLYKKVGGLSRNFRLAGDWDLWKRFAQLTPVVHIQRQLGAFRRRPGQLSMDLTNYWIEMEKVVSASRRAVRLQGLIPEEPAKFNILLAEQARSDQWLVGTTDISSNQVSRPCPPSKTAHLLTCTSKSSAAAPLFQPGFSADDFTFSRISHMRRLAEAYLVSPRGDFDIWYCDLKAFQDAFCTAFIDQMLPEGCKILEVGGGHSRVLHLFHNQHECWNIDKFEGVGNGLTSAPQTPYKLVLDYMGAFNPELPDNYFDLVFSISALEHLPEGEETFRNVTDDINRVLKPGGWSLHLLDIINKPQNGEWWTNAFAPYVFNHVDTLNRSSAPAAFPFKDDIFWMPKQAYEAIWQNITQKSYEEFGTPGSMQIFWRKPMNFKQTSGC